MFAKSPAALKKVGGRGAQDMFIQNHLTIFLSVGGRLTKLPVVYTVFVGREEDSTVAVRSRRYPKGST